MISSLEKVDQWFGEPRRVNNASITTKYGPKMVHFYQKYGFAQMRNASRRSNELSSLFLPVIITSISNENCSSRGHTLLSWLWIRNKCSLASPKFVFFVQWVLLQTFPLFFVPRILGIFRKKGGGLRPPPGKSPRGWRSRGAVQRSTVLQPPHVLLRTRK